MLVESLLCLFVFLKSLWKVRLVHVEVTKERQCNPSCSRYIAAATAALPLATKFARRLLSFSAHCPTVLLSVHLALETGVSRFLHPCELSPVRKLIKRNERNCKGECVDVCGEGPHMTGVGMGLSICVPVTT